MVVTVWSSMDEFQALAMRLAANVLLPGTGWVAFPQFMDLVGLMMDIVKNDDFYSCICGFMTNSYKKS